MLVATTDPVALIGAVASLVSAVTVAFLAISGRIAARRAEVAALKAAQEREELDRKMNAVARTTAVVATKVATVDGKIDNNTAMTNEIHREVKTTNGITGGQLAERTEGRRIELIAEDERTPSEQEYVDKLVAGGRNMGHPEADPEPAT